VKKEMKQQINKKSKAISPIIATLLLILIAIAAGVVVYAYVIGFVGNSTGNTGSTQNDISIDQVYIASATTSFPSTVYVRNLGPAVESFDVGFYLKSSTLSSQLAPAVSLQGNTVGATITVTSVTLAYASATTVTVTVATTACTATTDEIFVNGFGVTQQTTTGSCTVSGAGTLTATLTLTGGLQVSSAYTGSATGLALSVLQTAASVVGVSTAAGAWKISLNTVGEFTLAQPGKQTTNPLTSGQTYTLTVTGTDGASTALSAKSS
jgi:archaeal type IV pilus assembly protein PilA